ncbi:hypothetical protein GE061_020285 [Apolygus lucorum]|uniref:Uncharacterized protein n=1 Tax=Apolygus lucorum TaxID=248454 RepID=A0A6A4INT3_APOLU|nr:hypothetical protein GE061_020285 [Apolygus lucorum]
MAHSNVLYEVLDLYVNELPKQVKKMKQDKLMPYVTRELISDLQMTSSNSDDAATASLGVFHLTKEVLRITNKAFEKFGISAVCAGSFAEHVRSEFVVPYNDVDIFLIYAGSKGDGFMNEGNWVNFIRFLRDALVWILEGQVETGTSEGPVDTFDKYEDECKTFTCQCFYEAEIRGTHFQFIAAQVPINGEYAIHKDLLSDKIATSNMIRNVFDVIKTFDLINCYGTAFWLNKQGGCDALVVGSETHNALLSEYCDHASADRMKRQYRREKYCEKLQCDFSPLVGVYDEKDHLVVGECVTTGEKVQFAAVDADLLHKSGVCKIFQKIFQPRDIQVEQPISADQDEIKKFGLAAQHSLFTELWVLEFEFKDSIGVFTLFYHRKKIQSVEECRQVACD